MSSPPLIGISACVLSLRHDFHAAGDPYVRAVVAIGGVPVILPSLGAELDGAALLARLDGLLLTGSPSNVEPMRYGGHAPRPSTQLDARRDATTLPLIRDALAAGLPLLAICRGHQELNVALGGTLFQHVEELPGRLDHRAPPDPPMAVRYAPAHGVALAAGGALSRIAGGARGATVNSLHGRRSTAWPPASWSRRPHRTARSRRCASRARRASPSACSGIPSGCSTTRSPEA